MWVLAKNATKVATSLRHVLLNNGNVSCQMRHLRNSKLYLQAPPKQGPRKPSSERFSLKRPACFALAISLGGILHIVTGTSRVLCKAKNTRLAGYKKASEPDIGFDWPRFWLYLKPCIWYFVAAGALVVAVLNIEIPQVMGNMINVISKYKEFKDSGLFFKEMKLPAFKLVAMYVTQSLCTFFYIYMLSNLGEKIAFQMRRDLFAAIIKQDIAFFDQYRTGEIVNRLTSDIQDFKSSFKQTVSGGLRAATQIVGCSISLFMISTHMTLVTLMCIPTVIAVGTVFGALLRSISRKAQAQVERSTAVAEEAVSNIRTVRAFAMEDQEQQLFDSESELSAILNERLGFGIGWFQAGTNMFINGTVLATLYMGGYLLSTNQLSAGQLMAYLMASQMIQRSLGQLSLLFGSVVRGIAAGSRVFETVLKNFSLKIPAGKTVAIVGASGNGKSTVVALLERFYDINGGQITLDGHDIRSLDPTWLRQRALGLISQEPVLFGTSVLENIRYGKPDASDEEVKAAARMANAHDFVCSFPEGYDTLVGERGATLSGGQKQRIAIARALLKDPAVLLLDEATSALDTESEKIVQSALDRARKGRTVIVIAHRLSTVQNADIIVVLNKGRIVEMGTHEELKKLRGYYWSLTYQQQETPAG